MLSLCTAQENVDEVIIEVNSISEHMVLSNTSGSVIEEIFEEGKSRQLWIKGIPDIEEYFTLKNKEENLYLTLTPNTETNFFETKGT